AVGHAPGAEDLIERETDQRERLPGIGELPSHQHHEAETEEKENQPTEAVLNPDDFVVGREDVLTPKAELVVLVAVVVVMRFVMGFERCGCVHFRRIRALISKEKGSLQSRKLGFSGNGMYGTYGRYRADF